MELGRPLAVLQKGKPPHTLRTTLPSHCSQSEKLTASPDAQAQAHVTVNPLAHGANGPVDVTYPIKISVPHNYFLKAMNELGVPTNDDSVGVVFVRERGY